MLSLFKCTALLCLIALATSGIAIADDQAVSSYPSKPIRLIVPYPAGGGADFWGQMVARKLSETLGQPVIVENVPGFGGNNGTTAASKAAPDGYTLLLGSVGPLVVHPYTMGAPHRLNYFRKVLARIRDHRGVLYWTGEEILDWYLAQRSANN